TQIKTLEITLYCLLGFFISALNYKKKIYTIEKNSSKKIYKKLSYLLMIGLGILSFYSSFKLGINIFRNGYEYLLSGESDSRNLIMRIADEAFPVGYYLFLACKPSKREFKIMTGLFILFQCLELLKGARSLPMANVLLIIYIYFEIYEKKLNLKKALIALVTLLFLASLIGDLRSKQKFSLENFKNIAITQTITYTIIGQSIDEEKNLSNFNFYSSLYEPLEYWKGLLLNNLDMKRTKDLKTKVLADNLAYNLNPKLYLEGFGLGTNPIAEVNLKYGEIGVFIAFILMGIFIEKFIIYSEKGIIQKFIFLSILPYLFLLGRNSYFFIDLTKIIKICIYALGIKILVIILRRKRYE
ncbi:MAG: O-antigen polysaccharide polymerase Wzy, partial [Plesiomonas shigelloides]